MKKILGFLAAVCVLGLAIGTGKSMPDNAQLYIYENGKKYISPPCLRGKDFADRDIIDNQQQIDSLLILSRYSDLKRINSSRDASEKIHPDELCINNSGFTEDMTLLEKVVLGHPLISGERWNEDGTWNW